MKRTRESNGALYSGVDIFKLLFAAVVVLIHSQLLDMNIEIQNRVMIVLFSLAVPYFFLSSGFFLGTKLVHKQNYEQINKTFNKLLKLFLIFGSWYFCLEIVKVYILNRDDVVAQILFVVHRLLVQSPGGGLWYVYTALISVWVLKITSKHISMEKGIVSITVLSTVLFFFANFVVVAYPQSEAVLLYQKIMISDANFIFFSVYYFVGVMIGFYKEKIYFGLDINVVCIFLILAYVWYGFFMYVTTDALSSLIFSVLKIFTVVALFLISVKVSSYIRIDTRGIRKLSTATYFFHMTFVFLFRAFQKVVPITNVLGSILCLMSVILFSLLTIKHKENLLYKALFN